MNGRAFFVGLVLRSGRSKNRLAVTSLNQSSMLGQMTFGLADSAWPTNLNSKLGCLA
jgi:hypothetical protein